MLQRKTDVFWISLTTAEDAKLFKHVKDMHTPYLLHFDMFYLKTD